MLCRFEDQNDKELLKLVHFLECLLGHCHTNASPNGAAADVRPFIANKWNLQQVQFLRPANVPL